MANAHNVVNWRNRDWRPLVLLGALMVGLFAASFSAPAQAANRVVWKRTTIQEAGESWKIALEVHLDRAPDVALLPVRFSFTPVVHFENALVDGRKDPVIRRVPLEHQQAILQSMDVGFLDPATGKTAKRTRYSFEVTREHGFEAGQYEVTVTDIRSGKDFAGATTLTLDGKNKPVDRRSVVFDDSQAKAKKDDKAAAAAAAPEEKELSPEDDEFWAGGSKAPEEKESPLPPPAHMQERPGCGCRVAGGSGGASALFACGLAMLVWWRRRSALRGAAAG